MLYATASEMVSAGRWAATFDAGEPPISFRYGDRNTAESFKTWPFERASRPMDAQRIEQIVSYQDPASGLEVRGAATVYADFPAVEWVFTLENRGAAETPILTNIQPLDALFPVEPEQRCCVHHARGSQFRLEDFEPFATPLMLKVVTELRLATTGGRSSDGALPFMNLQMGEAGVMIAIGWTGVRRRGKRERKARQRIGR